jgi:hypothetical protein
VIHGKSVQICTRVARGSGLPQGLAFLTAQRQQL